MKKIRWIACAAFVALMTAQPLLAKGSGDMGDPWSASSIYYGATLITNHPDGGTDGLTADQVNRMRMTQGWLVGMKDSLEVGTAIGKSANKQCGLYLDKLTPYDLAKAYIEIKLRVKELNDAPAPMIAVLAFTQDKSCGGDMLRSYMSAHHE